MVLLSLILLLLLALLFLPLDIYLRLDSDLAAPDWEADLEGTLRWLVKLRWGWVVLTGEWAGENLTVQRSALRLFTIRLRMGSGRAKPRAERKERKQKKKRSRPDLELIWALVEEGARFIRRLIEKLGFRFQGEVVYGFADPAVTGWCEGIRWAMHLPVPIQLEPNFQHPCLTGWAEGRGRLYGYEAAVAALKALRHPVIKRRLAQKIRFKPLRYLLVRGG